MLSKGSVLVVDDEINLCRILGAKLAKSGFSVIAVHDGQQAVDKVRETNFDVVLLDLILPKVDGLSALAQIRAIYNDLPVIVMTACESPDAFEKAKCHGVSGYINKPFDLDSLVELVQHTSQRATKRETRRSSGGSILFAKDQPITLEVMNGKTSGVYASRIHCKDEHTLSVEAPIRNDIIVDVTARTPVRVGLAANDAYYSFNSYVLALQLSNTPMVIIDKPNVIYRNQRRQSQRLRVDVGVRYGRVPSEDASPDALVLGRSCDISAGGIRILSKERFEPGDLIYLEADSNDFFGPITAVAEVVRAGQSESDYNVSMKFRRLEGDLDHLVKK